MIIQEAVFIKSSTKLNDMPQGQYPEYAFIGRSNVGKSSLINMLTQRKGLAKISGKPGKTMTINHFLINQAWYLVDLPGYGYAKRSQSERKKWKEFTHSYLLGRKTLIYTFILVDVRLIPQRNDLEMMEWLAENQLPFVIVFTKSDKLKTTNLQLSVEAYKTQLNQYWEVLPPYIISSSETKQGREEIMQLIQNENELFNSFYSNSINN